MIKQKTSENRRTVKQDASLIMGKICSRRIGSSDSGEKIWKRWQLLHQTLALTNRLENVASGWRLKAGSCFRHALFRSLPPIQPSESCSAVAARDIWDFYLSWGPLDWLSAGLAVYCHIISHCLRLFNGGPSTCDREAFVSAVRSPTRPGASLGVWPDHNVSESEPQKPREPPLVLQSLSLLARVRRNLPARAWPGQCQGSGFRRGAH